MDFGALPPEINSGRMYSGPGCGSMLAAAAAWDGLAADLYSTAACYQSVILDLTSAAWLGPASVAMTTATAPYVSWLTTTAALCEQTAAQARAAAAAYENAFAMTVPPPMIAANRAQLMSLIATNILGQNTPAIAATEVHYGEMWAQDATAMYGYAGASATAATLDPFMPPPQTTNPAGLAVQGAAVAHATATPAASHAPTIISTVPQLISTVPHALQELAAPVSPTSSTSGLSGILQALSGSSPTSALSLLTPYTAALATTNLGLTSANRTAATMGTSAASETLGLMPAPGTGPASAQIPTQFTDPGGAGSAVSAEFGGAASIGTLSAPTSWAAATPPIRRVAATWPSTLPAATPTGPGSQPRKLAQRNAFGEHGPTRHRRCRPTGPAHDHHHCDAAPAGSPQLGLTPRWLGRRAGPRRFRGTRMTM